MNAIGTTIYFRQGIEEPLNFTDVHEFITYLDFAKEQLDKHFSRAEKEEPDGVLEFNMSIGSLGKLNAAAYDEAMEFEMTPGTRVIVEPSEDNEGITEVIATVKLGGHTFIAKT